MSGRFLDKPIAGVRVELAVLLGVTGLVLLLPAPLPPSGAGLVGAAERAFLIARLVLGAVGLGYGLFLLYQALHTFGGAPPDSDETLAGLVVIIAGAMSTGAGAWILSTSTRALRPAD